MHTQPPYIQALAGDQPFPGDIVIRPRSNRIPLAVLFAVLWSGGMLWRAPSINLQTVIMALIAGVVVGLLMYWLFDKFSGSFRG
jgi:hypothetical protein